MEMVEGRSRQDWIHTSELAAILWNGLLRGKGDRAKTPADINPYGEKHETKPAIKLGPKESMKFIRRMAGRKRKR